ncbi:uncharacterized protein LOC141912962 [Tubulanus polymorphus]|uniref:uncharacterized protein LOC141912962 n=1 Tax=Tubulanus polymorphus TaxID=672921 RepID=UPI003DA2B7BA
MPTKGQFNVREKGGGGHNDEDDDNSMDEENDAIPGKRSHNAGPSCVALRKECMSDDECFRDLKSFTTYCKVRKSRCYAESREACIQAYENLRPYGLFKCSCQSHSGNNMRRCSGLLKRYVKNACLLVANEVAKIGKEDNQLPQKPDAVKPEEGAIDEQRDPESTTFPMITTRAEEPKFYTVECYDAYGDCNKEYLCRRKMEKFIASCQWNAQKKGCDKKKCLPDMADYYQNVAVKHAHAAAFCVCEKSGIKCESLRAVLQPQCAVKESPTPSCLTLVRKCQSSSDCRRRWEYYNNYCHTDSKTGECMHGNHLCRDAVVGLMGTLLMTNCSCQGVQDEVTSRCRGIEERLVKNRCRAKAITPEPFIYEATPANNLLKDDKELIKFEVEMPPTPSKQRICANMLKNEKSPVIRVYPNNTHCSDLCKCIRNGTMMCQHLPCLPVKSCTESLSIYGHGSVIPRNNRGTCRCHVGEIICAKGRNPVITGNGIFLQVGYSQIDRENLRKFSINFNYEVLCMRLTNLLQPQPYGVPCELKIMAKTPGNIVFGVIPTRNKQHCIDAMRLLTYMIEIHHAIVMTDPLLSTIRVANVDVIEHFQAGSNSYHSTNIGPNNHNDNNKNGAAAASGFRLWMFRTSVLYTIVLLVTCGYFTDVFALIT